MLSEYFFAPSVGDILKLNVTFYTCTLSWRLPEVYQREPPDHIILTAKLDDKPYWEKTVTDFKIEEESFKVKPNNFFSVTLSIIHNKGTAFTKMQFEVPGTCTCTYTMYMIIMQFCLGTPNNICTSKSNTVPCAYTQVS